jgi:toxin-antitoxin system PIN domain toxin
LDVNVLLALLDPDHVHNQMALEWFEAQTEGWATCPITQAGFARVASQDRYPHPVTTRAALGLLEAATADEAHEFWPCDLAVTDKIWLDRERILGPAQLTDAYLLALAVSRAGRFVTLDRRVAVNAVVGAKPDQLVVLATPCSRNLCT